MQKSILRKKVNFVPLKEVSREKEKLIIMYFHNVNKFNARANNISGNCFPMTSDSNSSILEKVYITVTLLMQISFFLTMINNVITSCSLNSAQNNIITMLVSLELIGVSIYMNTQRDKYRSLIFKMNLILKHSSDNLKQLILDNFEPTMKPFKIFYFTSITVVFIWTFRPLFIIRDKDVFTTKDYQVEVNLIFFNDEFGIGLFLCGLVFQAISQIYLFCKQSGLSLYIIHFVRILTAEYQYVQENLSQVVRNSVDNKFDEELKHVLKQYSIIIQISKELPKLFSINVTTTYINSTIKLSILAYKVVHGSKDFFERLLVTFYASGIITEVYLMCDSIDLLKESSTSIFDQAFHEPWYKHNLSFKKIFLLMVLTNRMECRLTTCKPTDLTLPALKTILSNAYSAGLLLMGMQ